MIVPSSLDKSDALCPSFVATKPKFYLFFLMETKAAAHPAIFCPDGSLTALHCEPYQLVGSCQLNFADVIFLLTPIALGPKCQSPALIRLRYRVDNCLRTWCSGFMTFDDILPFQNSVLFVSLAPSAAGPFFVVFFYISLGGFLA